MRVGLGGLGWRPSEFWDATLTEFFEAIHGRNEANGTSKEQGAPSGREMEELLKRYG